MHFPQDEHTDLSLQLQCNYGSVPETLDALETGCLRLRTLKQRPGEHMERFLNLNTTNDQHKA